METSEQCLRSFHTPLQTHLQFSHTTSNTPSVFTHFKHTSSFHTPLQTHLQFSHTTSNTLQFSHTTSNTPSVFTHHFKHTFSFTRYDSNICPFISTLCILTFQSQTTKHFVIYSRLLTDTWISPVGLHARPPFLHRLNVDQNASHHFYFFRTPHPPN
jgi:hypothetical protein